MRRLLLWLMLCWLGGVAPLAAGEPFIASVNLGELPNETRTTLQLIERGGPFPYRRDGAVFGNLERRLPARPRGSYREYTVPTPGLRNRGARRIIAAAGGEYYYSDDHYRSFRRIANE